MKLHPQQLLWCISEKENEVGIDVIIIVGFCINIDFILLWKTHCDIMDFIFFFPIPLAMVITEQSC